VEVLVIPTDDTMNRSGRRVVDYSEVYFLLSPPPLPRRHFVETMTVAEKPYLSANWHSGLTNPLITISFPA
jgi:hypothetical protein